MVHLAGEPIAARRWDAAQKARIRGSRVDGTRALVEALAAARPRPRVLVCGSAVGYYGSRGDEQLSEGSDPGADFLAAVCVDLEREGRRAEDLGVRVCLLRTGLVLAGDGGALPRLALPFRLFAGGPLGSGRQWVSWIHREDVVGLVRFLVGRDDAQGPVNATAPRPETQLAFSRALGRALRRPCWLPVPAAALRLALGEMADALLLGGQRAIPARALEMGYRFRYADLEPALRSIVDRNRSGASPCL